jgi:hypothetical protein
MSTPFIQTAFNGGELSPQLYGHVDLQKFSIAASTMRNMFCNYRGGAYSRAGTEFCFRAKQSYSLNSYPPWLLKFQFSINQGYALEFGDNYMRVFYQGAVVLEPAITVTGVTNANPGYVSAVNSYVNGDWVTLNGFVGGMTNLNGNTYIVAGVSGTHFALTDLDGNNVNTTSFSAYSSGGTAARVFTLTTPYVASDLPMLKFTQSADVLTLTHKSYPPQDLTRITAYEWVLTPSTFAAFIAAPASCVGTATVQPTQSTSPPTLPAAYAYCVTAVSGATGEESVASPIANIVNSVDIASTAGSIVINWTSIPAATTYNIYKAPTSYNTAPGNVTTAEPVPSGAIFGYVGTSYGTQFVDSNITADDTQVPPVHNNPFAPGAILAVNVSSSGSGLSTVTPTVTTSTGSGAVFQSVVVNGNLAAVIVLNGGQGYVSGDTISFGGPGAYATGNITFSTIPASGNTLNLNGQTWTFVASSAGANQTLIGSSLAATLSSLAANLSQSSSSALTAANYNANATQLLITSVVPGTSGNTYSLAASNATPSGAYLTGGGSGTNPTGTLNVGPETGTYPGVVGYYQQRRVYAGTSNNPDSYWMSKPGLFLNFDSSIPVTDSDSITGTPWAQQVNGVQFMIPMPGGLIVFTGLGAWQVTGAGGSAQNPVAITPTSQQAQPQAFNGCSAICAPFVKDYDIIYVQAKETKVRDISYNYWANIYTGSDLTELSGQLFDGYTLLDVAWCEEPYYVAWYVRNDGVLLSLTYVKDQAVYGWARHDTNGQFLSVVSIEEPPVDAMYCVTTRSPTTAPNGSYYYIERMNNRLWNDVENCWCVDCGLQLAMPTPNATLLAGGTNGSISFSATAGVFSSSSVGSVIRMGGGIAVITSYVNPQQVFANVLRPITAIVPNSNPVAVLPQPAGTWSLTAPVSTVYVPHLQGLTVTGLADGVVIPPQVAGAGGAVTLPYPATNVIVGLPFQAQLQSVYLNTGQQPTSQGRRKTITAVTVRLDQSSGVQIGTNQPDGGAQAPRQVQMTWTGMQQVPQQGTTYVSAGAATVTNLFTGDERVNVGANWAKPGQVAVQQLQPFPMSITALIPEYLEGDTPEQTYSPQQQRDPRERPPGPGMWMLRG